MSDTVVTKARRGAVSSLWESAVRHQALVVPVVAVLLAFGIGALLISMQGVNPSYAYNSLFRSALFSSDGLTQTLHKAGPLILEGLAVAIAFRVGLFNIGAQGQLIAGAMATAVVGHSLDGLPGPLLIVTALVIGVLFGAMWASIAGLLKAYRNVHEVISTIMLNSIAAGIIDYLVTGPLQEEGDLNIPRTELIADSARLPLLGPVPVGFLLALVLAVLLAWLLARTTFGFRFNTVGKNKFAAIYAGINYRTTVIYAMFISGGLAALGGSMDVLGMTGRYESGFNPSLGFDGITIALLARGNPLATIPAALLVAMLRAGAPGLQFDTGIRPEVVDMLLAITLLLVSIPLLARLIFRKRAASAEAMTSGWGA